MPYATRISPRWWLAGLCLLIALGFAASGDPLASAAQEPALQPPAAGSDGGIVAGRSPGLAAGAVSAPYTRTDTFVLNRFEELIVESSRSSVFPAGVPGTNYEFRLSSLTGTGTVENIVVTWEGSGACVREPDNDIICTGSITRLSISYDYSYVPRFIPPNFSSLVGLSEDFVVDYTAILVYPGNVTFDFATVPPDNHDLPNRTLTWFRPNTTGWSSRAWFISQELEGLWLPMVVAAPTAAPR